MFFAQTLYLDYIIMAGMELDVEGAENISSRFQDKAEALRSGMGDALREIAQVIVDSAQANAPVDTGYLRDNIQIQSESDTEVIVVSAAEYSTFVEHGTRYMSAQPFFEPAIEEGRSQAGQILRDAFENV